MLFAAGRDEPFGQQNGIFVVEGEVAVALTIEIGDDKIGFAVDSDGVGGLFHVHRYRSACAQIIDKSHLELLRPHDAAVIGVALGDDDAAILVGGMDGGHALLFHPHLAEPFDVRRGCRFVEGADEFIPRSIIEQVVVQVFL